jgi:proteasome lid subunit RPN8/RPN11
MQIEVTNDAIEAMRRAGEEEYPQETCGIMLGENNRIIAFQKAPNVHSSPDRHFEIDPQVLIDAHRNARAGGLQVIGYYHSHPDGDPVPSVEDQSCASGDGRIWAIFGKGRISFWKDGRAGFAALSHRVIDG